MESLAHSNCISPRPRPIDPDVFFDVAKIRRYVEDATDLAVRAANGTTSAFLGGTVHSNHGFLGNGGAGGQHAKLSRERKHRMREMATQKLASAYRLDEIAASVATMQSASSLEEVARLVLQRNANDLDAKYVDFFHEKIPSRMLAESTSLEPLNEIICGRPTDGSLLRTRAMTKIFKNHFKGAAADLTEALAITRLVASQHTATQGRADFSSATVGTQVRSGGFRQWHRESKLVDDDQPKSLEPQLLFQRACVYLTLACQTLGHYLDKSSISDCSNAESTPSGPDLHCHKDPSRREGYSRDLEAKKVMRTYAKRAMRDYTSFLAFFDYTPGTTAGVIEECEHHQQTDMPKLECPQPESRDTSLDTAGGYTSEDIPLSKTVLPFERPKSSRSNSRTAATFQSPTVRGKVYSLSELLAAAPPADLPPYPAESSQMIRLGSQGMEAPSDGHCKFPSAEAVTYHPLLIEGLHSVLLCHCLVQTSPKEHLRHAHMVARLTRICDGYPIFLAARSPSRSDWMEVIHQADNWIGLEQSWESLCAPVSVLDESKAVPREKSQAQARERQRQEAVIESLSDDRVHDEATFQAAVASRERRAGIMDEDVVERNERGSKQRAHDHNKDFSIGTERAMAIAKWVKEAQPLATSSGKSRRSGEKGKMRKKVHEALVQDARIEEHNALTRVVLQQHKTDHDKVKHFRAEA